MKAISEVICSSDKFGKCLSVSGGIICGFYYLYLYNVYLYVSHTVSSGVSFFLSH